MGLMTSYTLAKPIIVVGQPITQIDFKEPTLGFFQELSRYSTHEQPMPTEWAWTVVALEQLATSNGAMLSRTAIDQVVSQPVQFIAIMIHLRAFFYGQSLNGLGSASGDLLTDSDGPPLSSPS